MPTSCKTITLCCPGNMDSTLLSETAELDVRSCSDLPSNALLSILQRLNLSNRLGNCSLVCESWADAARQITSSISLANVGAADRLEGIQQWLEAYGSSVHQHQC